MYFNGAGDGKLPSVEQSWSVEYVGDAAKAAKNREVLNGIAAIMKEFPALGLQVHGETGHADTAPDRLAAKYGLHPRKDVQACMDHLAANRATACMDALKARGIASSRLVATHQARTGSLKVDFLPHTMPRIAEMQRLKGGPDPEFDPEVPGSPPPPCLPGVWRGVWWGGGMVPVVREPDPKFLT